MEIELSFTTDEIRLLRDALIALDGKTAAARPSFDQMRDNPQARELGNALVKTAFAINALQRKLPVVR